ncbi:glycerol-3-phosphate dehydrogenase [Arcanobacterium pluranimalium]|uniref:anaerobic glycerol-3-phosphate dehydrogenase subunit GlpA n=1 Tax=Arcanobacterium pluranimalium TaxID=108028 RepID=UPI00195AF234|nr:anaerobic glycerol-3-phosphate dehydrogenase subunit GlpA [Arcanobacterium pluranimalium]MBM7825922.1 glycerol-3-phosphate dehydrogenase [Arcanobacterium pluranimalium]
MRRIETDVVVIGGGATGAGTVRDLAMRGFRAVLVERADLAQGTTGRFHGLLHSGGRYVVSDPGSATECAEENAIIRRIHSDAVEETGGLFVVTPQDTEEHADKFLKAARDTRVPAAEISIAEALRREPRLNPGIKRAFEVEDGAVDGWRMTWGAAESAKAYGAKILSYHRVTKIVVEDGAVQAVLCRAEKTGEDVRIDCHFVINAAGPWAGQIAEMAGAPEVDVVPGRGIMVAMNHRLVNSVVNRCIYPADGDIIVPAHTVCIIGTTDEAAKDPDFLEIKDSEVQQMLDAGEALIPGFRQARAVHVWAGARPLIKDRRVSASDTRHMSRGMSIIDHESRDGISGMLTIAGGKLTTYRLMAKNVVDAMCEKLGEHRECTTDQEAVPSAQGHPTHKVTDRLKEREADRLNDPIVCECELVTRSMIEKELANQPDANLDDIRRKLRVGMGPCQGGFCSLRAAGIMHDFARQNSETSEVFHGMTPEQLADRTSTMLRLFVGNRSQGIRNLLYGQQLREAALDKWILSGALDIDHLPAPNEDSRRATGDLALLHGRHDGVSPTRLEPAFSAPNGEAVLDQAPVDAMSAAANTTTTKES